MMIWSNESMLQMWNYDHTRHSDTTSNLLTCTGAQIHLSFRSMLRTFATEPVTLGKEDVWPAYPLTPFDGMEAGAAAVHFCDVSHLQDISNDGGRALPHLTDLHNLRKNPIFLRDLIPSDCAPALDKITLRGSGGPGHQPTFGGQHHLCLISFGVGFIFNFTGGSTLKIFWPTTPRGNSQQQMICPCNAIVKDNWPGSKDLYSFVMVLIAD